MTPRVVIIGRSADTIAIGGGDWFVLLETIGKCPSHYRFLLRLMERRRSLGKIPFGVSARNRAREIRFSLAMPFVPRREL
jgi:hypothetical protein